MTRPTGLRERKKLRTRNTISSAAIDLFLEKGFDHVSVSEIAAAAEVTKSTVFVYFAGKDELVLHRAADHLDEPARVVRERIPGKSPLDALTDHFLAQLAARNAITGLCDKPEVIAYNQLLFGTPSLAGARARYQERMTELLTDALHESAPEQPALTARLAAGQITMTQMLLMRTNQERMAQGTTADGLAAQARDEAAGAFAMLRGGLTPYAGCA
ncbi:TetR/AcrR family transcriptional regulator [Streptomyces sp. cg28]|uniref:TetR/AcrR family transcriptional regulator n=1 Tax=Streptomyces sp. cg28 TaxID=3403457 RepID=UPI003B215473